MEASVRVLVTGGRGLLGTEIQHCFTSSGDEVHAPGRTELDITDRAAVMDAVDGLRPELIINCAAWTAVDACESDPQRALLVNGTAAGFVAEAARAARAHVIHLSTDYVFSGALDRPYRESDEPGPQSVYGGSKLAGELAVTSILPTATVVRTSWLCGEFGPNMAATILRLARNGQPLRFVSDQRGHPTFAADLAPMIRRVASERIAGIVHVTNQGDVSWFEFAQSVLRAARLDPDRVVPIRTDELVPARPAARPRNSVLDNAVLRALGIPLLRRYEEALGELTERLTG